MIEVYRLTLSHYAVDEKSGERVKLDEPLVIENVYDRRFCGSSILLNRMFDELKHYAIEKMGEVEE